MTLPPVLSEAAHSRERLMEAFVDRAPKAEVHVHLEGAAPIAFLSESARRHGLAWAGDAGRELAARARFDSFAGFLALYRWVLEEHFRSPEDYVSALGHVAATFRSANIRYAEVSISAGPLVFFARPLMEIAQALDETAAAVERDGGPEIRFVADAARQHGPDNLGRVLDVLVGLPRARWPALGLAGDEAAVPAREFASVFAAARESGIAADIHAGEAADVRGIGDVLEHLAPDRLIHAVAAARDPALVLELRRRRLPLALNPTSNVRTRGVASLPEHPVRRFLRAGLVVSVNTDDPALFGTTLAGELATVARTFHLGQFELETLLLGGLECAFLPESRRLALLESWAGELERLRCDLGLDDQLLGTPPDVIG